MSSPSQNPKPDLDESINVTQAHGRVERETAAAAREKRLADNGHEPVSLWMIAACGIVLLIAGGVLGDAGTLFSYDSTFKEGYVRDKAPGGADEGPKPKTALAAYSGKGAKIYSLCSGCHGSTGKGDANYPSLAGSEWVNGDTQKLAMIILNGLQGPTSTGKTYGAGVMPAVGAALSADDLATLMTYIRNGFGNSSGDIVSPEMAQNALDVSAAREKVGQPITAEEIAAKHMIMLPGEPIAPETMVNPISLAPAQ